MTTAWQQVPQQERQPGSDVPARSVPVSMSAPESGGEPELAAVLQQFPPVAHAFAYGSGVFRQPGLYPLGSGDRPMLDFIFAVDAPAQWHAQNLEMNRPHYSFVGSFGTRAVNAVANSLGAGVYFNTMVPWRDQHIKYGVVDTGNFCGDLERWDALYCAGRLHKPVTHLLPLSARVAAAQAANLDSAVTAALLLLPAAFSSVDLLCVICGLSYMADIRMAFAEDSRKVERLVRGSAEGLAALYEQPMRWAAAKRGGLTNLSAGRWAQDDSPVCRHTLLSQLPAGVLSKVAVRAGMGTDPASIAVDSVQSRAAVAEAALHGGQHQRLLRRAIAATVRASSRQQAVAGLFSAGPLRSLQYVWQKVLKAWHSS